MSMKAELPKKIEASMKENKVKLKNLVVDYLIEMIKLEITIFHSYKHRSSLKHRQYATHRNTILQKRYWHSLITLYFDSVFYLAIIQTTIKKSFPLETQDAMLDHTSCTDTENNTKEDDIILNGDSSEFKEKVTDKYNKKIRVVN